MIDPTSFAWLLIGGVFCTAALMAWRDRRIG